MAQYELVYIRKKISDKDAVNVKSSKDVFKYLYRFCFKKDELWREKTYALYASKTGDILGHLQIGVGAQDNVTFDTKLTVKGAIDLLAKSIILIHNHPSGNPLPSRADKENTMELQRAADLFGINILDHIILGEKEYFSFAEEIRKKYPVKHKSTTYEETRSNMS